MGIGRPKKSNPLSFQIKVMVDEDTYEALGNDSAKYNISMAEILRRSYLNGGLARRYENEE